MAQILLLAFSFIIALILILNERPTMRIKLLLPCLLLLCLANFARADIYCSVFRGSRNPSPSDVVLDGYLVLKGSAFSGESTNSGAHLIKPDGTFIANYLNELFKGTETIQSLNGSVVFSLVRNSDRTVTLNLGTIKVQETMPLAYKYRADFSAGSDFTLTDFKNENMLICSEVK